MHSTDDASSQADSPTLSKPPTLELCHAVIQTQAAHIANLEQRLAAQEQHLALLQERLKLDSHNSSKPPSSDGPGRPNRAQRRASERKRGAQKGHPGSFRALLPESDVDSIHDCLPPPLCECGSVVVQGGEPFRHQVTDVPPIKPRVDEYRLYSGVCSGCRKPHRAKLPAGVPAGQLGPGALSLVGELGTRYQMSQHKVRDLLAEVMGVDFSIGCISQAHGKVALALAAPVAQAVASVAQAPVLHLDETRYPREGSTGNWVWGAVTPSVTVFNILPSRARYVVQDLIGQQPTAVVVSDRYSAYAYIDAQQRQICWSHLLRDFARVAERPGLPGRVGHRLLAVGYLLFRWRDQGRSGGDAFEQLQRRLRRSLETGVAQTACKRTAAVCANLLKLWPALWTFADDPQVQPTNNAAEQALRGIVIKRKISGPTRSRRGDDFIARGFSAWETCRRQGRDFNGFLHHCLLAWIDKTEPPSLLPAPSPSG
jgi:transposase